MTSPLYPVKQYSAYVDQTLICFEEGPCAAIPIQSDQNLPVNNNWSSTLTWIVNMYLQDAAKIRNHYPDGLSHIKHLDFSNLGLITLPPHILLECKAARSLDISGNDISSLPIQLKELRLKKLDISRNKGMQCNLWQFDWLPKMPKLHLVANDIGFNFIPRKWEGRFSTNELPVGYDLNWDCCPTQCSSDEGDN